MKDPPRKTLSCPKATLKFLAELVFLPHPFNRVLIHDVIVDSGVANDKDDKDAIVAQRRPQNRQITTLSQQIHWIQNFLQNIQ